MPKLRLLILALIAVVTPALTASADIFRWDNGKLIPGTENLDPAPLTFFNHSQLAFADLGNTDLSDSFFSKVDLANADLSGSNLADSYIDDTVFADANLANADLRGVILQDIGDAITDFRRANLSNADLRDAMCYGCENGLGALDFSDATFVGADLSGARFRGATFVRANLSNANLRGMQAFYADMTDAQLVGADLRDTSFHLASFTGADLTDALVTGAQFGDLVGPSPDRPGISEQQLYSTASYKEKDLRGINLAQYAVGWDFRGQDLRGARLEVVTESDFSGAQIQGARFRTDYGRQPSFSAGQLYSTASYQQGDLAGIRIDGNLDG